MVVTHVRGGETLGRQKDLHNKSSFIFLSPLLHAYGKSSSLLVPMTVHEAKELM